MSTRRSTARTNLHSNRDNAVLGTCCDVEFANDKGSSELEIRFV